MGYFRDEPDFDEMTPAELQAALDAALVRLDAAATPRDVSASAITIMILREHIEARGLHPMQQWRRRYYRRGKSSTKIRARGQHEAPL